MPDRTLMVSFINSNFFKVGVQIKLKQLARCRTEDLGPY